MSKLKHVFPQAEEALDEQLSQKSAEDMTRIKMLKAMQGVLAPLVTVGCGFLLGYLTVTLIPWMHDVPYFYELAFPLPLCLGIAAAFTAVRRKTHLVSQAMKRGLLVWLGMGLSWLPLAWRADAVSNAACAHMDCHVSGIETSLLVIYLFYGVVLVLLGSVIISLLIKRVMKYSQRTPFDGP